MQWLKVKKTYNSFAEGLCLQWVGLVGWIEPELRWGSRNKRESTEAGEVVQLLNINTSTGAIEICDKCTIRLIVKNMQYRSFIIILILSTSRNSNSFCNQQILNKTPPKEADQRRSHKKSDSSLEHGAASQRTEANDMRLQKQLHTGCTNGLFAT